VGSVSAQLWLPVTLAVALSGGQSLAWAETPRSPREVVADLGGQDWKASRRARDEAARLGARVVPTLLAARAAAPAESPGRAILDDVLRGIVDVLAAEVGKPLAAAARRVTADGALGGMLGACDRERPDMAMPELTLDALGDVGSISAAEPMDWFSRRERARRARGALSLLGPAVTTHLLRVPPARERNLERVLLVVAGHIYERERGRALAAATPSARQAFLDSYRGLADLAGPIVAAGIRDDDARVRDLFQEARDQVLRASLAGLSASNPAVREVAEDSLFRLGELVRPSLVKLAESGETAQARESAARLAQRIRWGLSRALILRLGHTLEGFEELPFRERRARVFELERLGGAEAIPTLRAILQADPSDEIRSVAAIGLFRQRDPVGAEWLALNRHGLPLGRLSPRELAGIFMRQGIQYLGLGRLERAEREFKQVLELESDSEVGWYNLACTYARWGKIDLAFEHLERAIELGFDDVTHMESDSDLENLRDDPRFRQLLDGIEASRSRQ